MDMRISKFAIEYLHEYKKDCETVLAFYYVARGALFLAENTLRLLKRPRELFAYRVCYML